MPAIGIDIGGTFIKGALMSEGHVIGEVIRARIPDFIDASESAREIDPAALMTAVWEVLTSLVGDASAISSVWITGQMASVAYVDEQGDALAPIISWQDERSGSVDAVRAALGDAAVAATGDGLRPALPLVRLSALPAPAGSLVGSLMSFVAGSVCGHRAESVHITDAASWGMVDLTSGRWSLPILEFLGIEESRLPDVTAAFIPVGNEVRTGAPVMVAVADQQASLRGAGVGYGEFTECVSVNLATGCQVSIVSAMSTFPAQLRPYFAGRWLHTVTHLPAGRLLTAAVEAETGGVSPGHWVEAAGLANDSGPVGDAVREITAGVAGAVRTLGADGRPIRFSGGLVQQFHPLQETITAELNVPGSAFPGDDAALAGLAALALESGT